MADPSPGVLHADSIDSNDDHSKSDEKKKSRRPANTAFRQQRLKAWQPILTPKTVLPLFFAIGIIFAPIGGLLLYASAQVQELRIDYTDCATSAPTTQEFGPMDPNLVTTAFKTANPHIDAQWRRETVNHTYVGTYSVPNLTQCVLQFRLPEDMQPPVLMYYQLTDFYQNHRRYVSSFYDKQLLGNSVDASQVSSSSCYPLTIDSATGLPYYPCGLIANSMFNDTIFSPVLVTSGDQNFNETYPMQDTSNIAWDSDKALYGKLPDSFNISSIVPPPNWVNRYPDGKYSDAAPPTDPSTDQHFIVWMRTAGLPTFSKLYMRNDNTTMRNGTYSLSIISNFPTANYTGTKSIIITTKTVMGGRNPFLGIAYIVVGGLCIILGGVFTVTHLIHPRKLGDHTHLSWNKVQTGSKSAAGNPAVGMSTGRDLA